KPASKPPSGCQHGSTENPAIAQHAQHLVGLIEIPHPARIHLFCDCILGGGGILQRAGQAQPQ
ncbi:MAG: hypothetical protein JSV48_07745, partial [Bradyrhizobium sp.]